MARADVAIDAPELESDVRALVGDGRVKANYVAGDWVREAHGAPCLMSIGVTNSNVARRPRAERNEVCARIAEAAVEWLRAGGRLAPGTLISIGFFREVDLLVINWSIGAGGCAFWVETDMRLTTQPTVDDGNKAK